MNTYIQEWKTLLDAFMKFKEENTDLESLREDILRLRDKLLVRYGVYQDLISFLKPSKTELATYQSRMNEIEDFVAEIGRTLDELESELIHQGINIRRSMVSGTVEELIKDTFRKEVFEMLVKQERRSLVTNETKRVEIRFPVQLLREIDDYQEINEISNRSQTIFELCRMGLKAPTFASNRVVINSSMQRLKDNYLQLKEVYEQNQLAVEKMNFLLSEDEGKMDEKTWDTLKRTCEKVILENTKYEKNTDGVVNPNE